MISDVGDIARRRTQPPRIRSQETSRTRVRRAMLAPLVILLLLLTIYPTVYAVVASLFSTRQGTPAFVGLGNYIEKFGDPVFQQSIAITLVFTIAAVGLELVLGLAVALVLFDMRGEHRLIRALLLLPMAATPVAVLFGWKVILDPSLGVLNWMIGDVLGLARPDWLGTPGMALGTLIGVDVWQWTPFVMIILFGGLTAVSGEVVEAALIDGAGWWTRLRYVILPALQPYLMVAVLFRGVDALKTFDSIQVLTGGGPGSSTTTINVYAFKQGIQFLDFGSGSAAAIILLIVAMAFGKLASRFMAKEAYA
ncbi:sugar ABC transporter permease [Saxibacter everestensis]|uniref:Sugar ABC transporter permease n=1 Tax=Saxibacter everestensis TaxID=2909229 RepID=A0ABY8QWY7_9MICO|nr:sugar ABC transporter permease [Brevibacteriaceae bacterium ZFBP1038]